MALLLPAVQKMRDSANLLTCKNNLRQIGMALHDYHNVNGSFPVGYYDPTPWPQTDNGPGWGWASFLLPFLEQQPLYELIDFSLDVGDPANAAVVTTYLKVFRCPSDDVPQTFTVTDGGSNSWTLAQSNYVACNGNDGVDDFTTPPHTGAFRSCHEGLSRRQYYRWTQQHFFCRRAHRPALVFDLDWRANRRAKPLSAGAG